MPEDVDAPDLDGVETGSGPRADRWSAALAVITLLAAALIAFAIAPVLLPASYSWTEHGISESAAQGVEQAWLARLGFIAFGLAVLRLAGSRPPTWGPLATGLHLVFGLCMFGVAAFSAKPWDDEMAFVERDDVLHSWFAGVMGFAFIVGVVTLIVERRRRSLRAALGDWAVVTVAVGVSLAMSASVWGVLQRLMFLAAAVWYGHEAFLATDIRPRQVVGNRRTNRAPRPSSTGDSTDTPP